ncbi:MAG: flagellar hook-basal body complex protein FliE [Treponema sp.]|nr:flagellar hook-basal body complex protein FliE [Treponema sp.]MCL2251003.1 flagellar hook-basal body complex protein FliE [Treponema sp.]
MEIFNNNAYISLSAAKDYATTMIRTHTDHMMPPDSPYAGSGKNILALRDTVGAGAVTGIGKFEDVMLNALDKVSGVHHKASDLQKEAFLNPDSVDIHDITIAQAEADMALGIARNILSRLVQGWRDLINTR